MQNLRVKTLLSTELKDAQISNFSSTRFWQGEKTPQKGTMLKFSATDSSRLQVDSFCVVLLG
jgi:hypothetical protein